MGSKDLYNTAVCLLLVCMEYGTHSQETESAYGCDRSGNKVITLTCSMDNVIHITGSVLGTSLPIPNKGCSHSHCTSHVSSDDELLNVQRNACDGQSKCEVETVKYEYNSLSNNSDLTDFQYINYACLPGQKKHLLGCLNGPNKQRTMTLECPSGKVIHILDCMVYASHIQTYPCGNKSITDPRCTNVLNNTQLNQLRDKCDGLKSCSFGTIKQDCKVGVHNYTSDYQAIEYTCLSRNLKGKAGGSTHTQGLISLECPLQYVIHITSSTIGYSYELNCHASCCGHTNLCRMELARGSVLLMDQQAKCDQQRSCIVTMLNQECHETPGEYANYQLITYECKLGATEEYAYRCQIQRNLMLQLVCPSNQHVNITRSTIGIRHPHCPANRCCLEDAQCLYDLTKADYENWIEIQRAHCTQNTSCLIHMLRKGIQCGGNEMQSDLQLVFFTCVPGNESTTSIQKSSSTAHLPTQTSTVAAEKRISPEPAVTTSHWYPSTDDKTDMSANITPSHNSETQKFKSSKVGLIAGLVGCVVFLSVLALVILLVVCFIRKRKAKDTPAKQEDSHIYQQDLEGNGVNTGRFQDNNKESYELETVVDPAASQGDYDYAYGHLDNKNQENMSKEVVVSNDMYSDINPQAKTRPREELSTAKPETEEDDDAVYTNVDKSRKMNKSGTTDEEVILAENDMYVTRVSELDTEGDLHNGGAPYERSSIDNNEVTLAENDMYTTGPGDN